MPFCCVVADDIYIHTDDVRLKVDKHCMSPISLKVSFASILHHVQQSHCVCVCLLGACSEQQRLPFFSFDKTASISIVSSCISRLCHTICYYLCIKPTLFPYLYPFGLCLVCNRSYTYSQCRFLIHINFFNCI